MSFFRATNPTDYINAKYQPGSGELDFSGYKGKIIVEDGFDPLVKAFENFTDVKTVNFNGHPEVFNQDIWNGLRLVIEYLPNVSHISLKQIEPPEVVDIELFVKLLARGIKIDCDPGLIEVLQKKISSYLQESGQQDYLDYLNANGWNNLDKDKFQASPREQDAHALCQFIVSNYKSIDLDTMPTSLKGDIDRYLRSHGQEEYANSLKANNWKNIEPAKFQAALDFVEEKSINKFTR